MENGIMLGLMFAGVAGPIAAWGMWDSWLKHRAKTQEGASNREVERLTHEKEQMQERMEMMEDRLAVLETIATDPARRTAEEIEKLR
jgi:hypothetical protein